MQCSESRKEAVRLTPLLTPRTLGGASGTGTSGQADTAEEVGLDRTHPQEASIQHHTPNPDQEPAGQEEERPASQQLEARHRSRAETAGDQLVRNDKSSPEQSAMAGGH